MLDRFSGLVLIGISVFGMLAVLSWRIDPELSILSTVGIVTLFFILAYRFMTLVNISYRSRVVAFLMTSLICAVLSVVSYDYQDNNRLVPPFGEQLSMLLTGKYEYHVDLTTVEVKNDLSNSILKAFCIDLYGYPALNRDGYAWSYLGTGVEPRIDGSGNPIRCMTRKEYESFFEESFNPQFSYFDDE